MSTIILGVDPGSKKTGFGLIEVQGSRLIHLNHGVILLDEESFAGRLRELGLFFSDLLKKYQPHHVVVEKIFLGKNADSAFKLGHARGVIMYKAALSGAEVFEYATRVVKKSVTGNGGAEKDQVQATLQALLRVNSICSLDASDALAMAYHHAIELNRMKLFKGAEL